jgi:hypothetical protein
MGDGIYIVCVCQGALGNIESKYFMGLLLAHALRLEKFGA